MLLQFCVINQENSEQITKRIEKKSGKKAKGTN